MKTLLKTMMLCLTLAPLVARADSYQIYFPDNSQFVAGELPVDKQKLFVVNTDTNIVQEVSMRSYLNTTFPTFEASVYGTQVDFTGSSRVIQDFVGSTLIIRDNNLITARASTADNTDPLFGVEYTYDRIAKINVSTGAIERDYVVARSQAAYDAAVAAGYDVVLADGADGIGASWNTMSLKTFATNTTTSTGSLATDGGFSADKITAADGASLFRQESDGTVHIGENSIVFADESVSSSGYDTIYSSSGVLQLGNSSSDRTIINGALEIQEPTAPNHAATKNYVDTNFYRKDYVDGSLAMSFAMSALPRAMNGESIVGVGLGQHGSQGAIAFGLSRHVPSRDIVLNVNLAHSPTAKTSAAVGVGWKF
jgi:hypothetical protein